MAGSTDIRAWLEAHVNLERGVGIPSTVARATAPTLDRIRAVLELLGSPQLDVRFIHVTGTNGKTSTVRIIAELLRSSGLKVGTYTSPNLERVNERMTIDGEEIDDEQLDELLRTIARAEPFVSELPSYFEILTAAAFYWFADEAVDVAVVEVGLGGTWDATNVIEAEVAVVTNVAVDHTEYLGSSREAIAAEKAGIIKAESVLVLGESAPELVDIFLARPSAGAIQRGTDFEVVANQVALRGRVLDVRTPSASYGELFLGLHGAHQADNAVIALAAAEAFEGSALSESTVRRVFANVTSPGRLEVVGRHPLVLLDGAHNLAGAEALRASLDQEFAVPATEPFRTLVVGLLREKEPHEMLAALGLDDATRLILCAPPSPRALDPALVAKAAEELGFPADRIEIAESVREAVGLAIMHTGDDGQILITGSLYMVGAARTILKRDHPTGSLPNS